VGPDACRHPLKSIVCATLYSYVGRQSSASTATGSKSTHLSEQSNILSEAFN